MCGIAGVIGIESKENGEGVVRRMLRSIVHRGPDAQGTLITPRVAVGVRRLSIIDLPGGNQPVWNENRTVAVVFNGEIYNFRALRHELGQLRHRFRTVSDTEVIVHAYEEWGENCLQRLDGMFALAVLELPQGPDGACSQVFLARDRLGIKPLYYAVVDGGLYFASEVRALIAGGGVPARISAEAVPSYLLFGSVAEPGTFVDQVCSLPPACAISINPAEPVHAVDPGPYWTIDNSRRRVAPSPSPTDTPPTHVRALLSEAVNSHLVADVPVGIFLSGGIDSTAIAALASRAQSGIHTFTVAFPEAEFSEAAIAQKTAKSLSTNHSEVSISDDEMVRRIDESIAAFDQPTADAVNTYFVSWAAKQAGLKVALSGLGSDELFGGYTSFHATCQVARLAKLGRLLPAPVRAFVADRLRLAKSSRWSHDALRKGSAALRDPELFPHAYFFTRALFTPHAVGSLLNGASTASTDWHSAPWSRWLASAVRQSRHMDQFTTVSWLELRSYLLNTLLRDTDAMSMAHSLEVRVPFLDISLVEYVLSLPESAKRANGRPKSLLVDAVRDILPPHVLDQPKRTFTFPWKIWLRGKLGERVGESLHDWAPELEPHVDSHSAIRIWNDFLKGRTTWSRPWSLYVLNEWTKRNLRGHSSGTGEDQNAAAATAA